MNDLPVLTGINNVEPAWPVQTRDARLMICFDRLVPGAFESVAFIGSLQYYINIQ